jgi:hypothetical protein
VATNFFDTGPCTRVLRGKNIRGLLDMLLGRRFVAAPIRTSQLPSVQKIKLKNLGNMSYVIFPFVSRYTGKQWYVGKQWRRVGGSGNNEERTGGGGDMKVERERGKWSIWGEWHVCH